LEAGGGGDSEEDESLVMSMISTWRRGYEEGIIIEDVRRKLLNRLGFEGLFIIT
jgi:hypothetical protein